MNCKIVHIFRGQKSNANTLHLNLILNITNIILNNADTCIFFFLSEQLHRHTSLSAIAIFKCLWACNISGIKDTKDYVSYTFSIFNSLRPYMVQTQRYREFNATSCTHCWILQWNPISTRKKAVKKGNLIFTVKDMLIYQFSLYRTFKHKESQPNTPLCVWKFIVCSFMHKTTQADKYLAIIYLPTFGYKTWF